MAKLTEEERLDRQMGYRAGRLQAKAGRPWGISSKTPRSKAYMEAHRRAYLAAIAKEGLPEPTGFSPRKIKPLKDSRLQETYERGLKAGYVDGFREAMRLAEEMSNIRTRGSDQWSDQKVAGYQRGYRQAKAGHPKHSSGDLRADPDFNDGYEMGHSAGSKILQSA
jgi:hypothetical protein